MKVTGRITNYNAGATVNPRRIVKHGSSDTEAIQAAGNTDLLIGVSDSVGTHLNGVPDANGVIGAGEPLDVHRSGIAYVDYGGNVTRGQKLTSDANGKAIAATAAAGSNVEVIGVAEISGVNGDIGQIDIVPSTLQG